MVHGAHSSPLVQLEDGDEGGIEPFEAPDGGPAPKLYSPHFLQPPLNAEQAFSLPRLFDRMYGNPFLELLW